MGDEQDMRKMGGLRTKLPVTFWTMTAGVIAIAGIYPFAGFFSKDAILAAAFEQGTTGKVLWFVGLLTALLTAIYMFRLWYLTFFGESRSPQVHPHESPLSMLGPMGILALLSLAGGWIGIERFSSFLQPATGVRPAPASGASQELLLSALAVATALLGWFIADLFYRQKPARAQALAASAPAAYRLLANKYYVDQILNDYLVRPLLATSNYFLEWVVEKAILGGAALLLGGIATFSGMLLQRWQSGNIRSYAAWLATGAAAVLLFLIVPWATVLANFGIHLNTAGH
jgi:NADH-quinone oxidoreductase subunit L